MLFQTSKMGHFSHFIFFLGLNVCGSDHAEKLLFLSLKRALPDKSNITETLQTSN